MTATPDLARALVDRIEGAETRSAAVLRNMAYRALTAAGIDIDRLRRDACLDQIATLEAKVKRAKTNKPFHELRLEAEKAKLLTFSHVPTRELVAQRGEAPIVESFEENGDQLRCERHRWQWPVDRVRHLLPGAHYAAAERMRWAYFTKDAPSRIADYGTSAGRSDPANRLPLTPDQEAAARAWNVFWLRMNPVIRMIAWNFILELPPRGHERPLTAAEFGKWYGGTTNESRARGITEAAIMVTCSVLAEIDTGYSTWREEQQLRRSARPQPLTEIERKYIRGERHNGRAIKL